MKNILVLLLCAILSLSAAACSSNPHNGVQEKTITTDETAASDTKINVQSDQTGEQTVNDAGDSKTGNKQGRNAQNEGGDSVQSNKADDQSPKNEEDLKAEDNSDAEIQESKATVAAGERRDNAKVHYDIDFDGKVEFSAKTVNGDDVNSSIFKDYKLTMINIWGTECKPCIKEMPEIQKLYEEMEPEKVNVVGFIANNEMLRDGQVELANKIIKEKGVSYMNLVFNDKLTDQIAGQAAGLPATVFVDSEGNVVGKHISGARNKEQYKKEIENRLKEMEK